MKFRFGVFNIVFLLLLTIGTSYAQQYPAGSQVKYPMNLYSQADTKGVLVIGSGAPSFTPKAKQSRVYVDSVAGNMYARKNGAWVLIAGKGASFAATDLRLTDKRVHKGAGFDLTIDSVARFSLGGTTNISLNTPSLALNGSTRTTITGNEFYVGIPSRVGTPDGSILIKERGDSLVYTPFGFTRSEVTKKGTMLMLNGSSQYAPTLKFIALEGGAEYDNDAAAAVGEVPLNGYYVLSATNTYSLPQGILKKRVL